MPRFFISEPDGSEAVITGADAIHIGRSLRMKPGEQLILCSNGTEYISVIKEISDSAVICNIIEAQPSLAERTFSFTCFRLCLNPIKWILSYKKQLS